MTIALQYTGLILSSSGNHSRQTHSICLGFLHSGVQHFQANQRPAAVWPIHHEHSRSPCAHPLCPPLGRGEQNSQSRLYFSCWGARRQEGHGSVPQAHKRPGIYNTTLDKEDTDVVCAKVEATHTVKQEDRVLYDVAEKETAKFFVWAIPKTYLSSLCKSMKMYICAMSQQWHSLSTSRRTWWATTASTSLPSRSQYTSTTRNTTPSRSTPKRRSLHKISAGEPNRTSVTQWSWPWWPRLSFMSNVTQSLTTTGRRKTAQTAPGKT